MTHMNDIGYIAASLYRPTRTGSEGRIFIAANQIAALRPSIVKDMGVDKPITFITLNCGTEFVITGHEIAKLLEENLSQPAQN